MVKGFFKVIISNATIKSISSNKRQSRDLETVVAIFINVFFFLHRKSKNAHV